MTNPEYNVYLPIWNKSEPHFNFTDGQRQTFVGNDPWRVSHPDKKEAIHERASSCGAIIDVYENAIAVGSPKGTSDTFSNGVMGILMFFFGAAMSITLLTASSPGWFYLPPLIVIILCFIGLSIAIRTTFFSIRDFPILFNKLSRTVTISKPRRLSILKFWQPVVIDRMPTYSWEAVQARTYKTLQMMGETSRESYSLTLLCTDIESPNEFKDFTYIGYVETWNDAPLWRLWEHIRRYMEEDGPPLQPGETLRTTGTGKLPKFSQHLIDAAGGEPLSIEEIEKLTGFNHHP